MAILQAWGGQPAVLATAQSGNFPTDIADRGSLQGPLALLIDTTAGATPTVTANIQGSIDGTNWFNVEYSLVATPSTKVVAAITITTTVITTYLVSVGYGWRYLRVNFTANTNVTINSVVALAH